MDHLREFERRGDDTAVPSWLQRVATPLIWREWDRDLSNHPSLEFREYILGGIKNGFQIGFNRRANCRSASRNLHSAVENAAVVREYLAKEVSLGRIVGPIVPSLAPANTQISPFGVIPKPHQRGKWHLIVDLSSPASWSTYPGGLHSWKAGMGSPHAQRAGPIGVGRIWVMGLRGPLGHKLVSVEMGRSSSQGTAANYTSTYSVGKTVGR